MSKAKTLPSTEQNSEVAVDLTQPHIASAIDAAKALMKEGKTKADAAWEIFSQIGSEAKEVLVAAFVAGAGLTPKGALTYVKKGPVGPFF